MCKKSALARLSFFAVAFIMGSALRPCVAGQQSPSSLSPEQAQAVADSFRRSQASPSPWTLNQDSKANDSAGIHLYSEHLIQYFVPERAGHKYAESLSGRLAKSEQMARSGKGSLVPEAKVAQAYNDLMKQTGAPASRYSDETIVRRLRHFGWIADPSPALFSAHQNGANCNPGEAVFLLSMLIQNNGGPREDPPSSPAPPAGVKPPTTRWFSQQITINPQAGAPPPSYFATHSRRDTIARFNAVAKTLGF